MKLKIRLFLSFKGWSALFFILAVFFLWAAPLIAAQDQGSLKAHDEPSDNQESATISDAPNAPKAAEVSSLAPVDRAVTSSLDAAKEMEKILQETIINEAKSYYPTISEMRVEASDHLVVVKLTYDQPSKNDLLIFKQNLLKDLLQAEIKMSSPLLQKIEESQIEGDQKLLGRIKLTPNNTLSANLGEDSKLFFVDRVEFQLLKPLRWKVTQSPGVLRIEFRPYLAEDEEETKKKEEEQDLVFQAPPLQRTEQILGQSYAQDRQYERDVVSDGEQTLLENLESRDRDTSELSLPTTKDYNKGLSEDNARAYMQQRYPAFGSPEYWKRHLSGVISNTARFLKRERNQSFVPIDEPGVAILFDREGPAHIRLGYNQQREFPFFYGKLHRESRLAPMDGFMRKDIQGGVVFKTRGPWTYSVQNELNIGTAENLLMPPKFGDRLTTYQYSAGQGLLYQLERGYLQAGSGLKWNTEELGLNEDVTGYLSCLWARRWTKKITTQVEHNFSTTYMHDPKPAIDRNIHKTYFGLEYKPNKNISLSPKMSLAFYDGESFSGLEGGVQYRHKLNARDLMTVSYSTNLSKVQLQNFGSESLTGTRTILSSPSALVRHQSITATFNHALSGRMNFIMSAGYGFERQSLVTSGHKSQDYRISVALNRDISRAWEWELKYALGYLDAYQWTSDDLDHVTKTDAGATNHSLIFRLNLHFGK